MPITLVILFGLFMVQRFGTARVGTAFGPIMLVWFVTIAILGIRSIAATPSVLQAINPAYGVQFFARNGIAGFLTLGAVVLCITGCEALYADMGHFGKRPIRLAWFSVALPSLMLNYFGQAALLLRDSAAATNPFYLLAPASFQWPLLVIATAGGHRRLAGADLGCVLAHAAEHPARLLAAHADRPHVGEAGRPDLRAGGEQGADDRVPPPRALLP